MKRYSYLNHGCSFKRFKEIEERGKTLLGKRVHRHTSLKPLYLVGASRFERPTSRTPSECAIQTALRPDYFNVCSRVFSFILILLITSCFKPSFTVVGAVLSSLSLLCKEFSTCLLSVFITSI